MEPGLCGHCAHCHLIEGARSRFYLCGLAAVDSRFRRYPALPVRSCPGHVEGCPAPRAEAGPADARVGLQTPPANKPGGGMR